MPDEYLKMILKARVYDVAIETPLDPAPGLSHRLDNRVWLKREDLQPVFSYKIRGAYNLMQSLTPAQRARGVVTASAGNHAQGVALAAQCLGLPALIVMPKTTPEIKVNAVRQRGAEIVLHGNTYDEAAEHARQLEVDRGMTYVHPYDHPLIIAGQGTVAVEILRQHADHLDAIFVPVGGGGLIAGVAAYVKQLEPGIRIIGVEPDDAPSMKRALEAGRRVVLDHVGIFADGAAVRQVGEETFRVVRELVDDVLLVSTDEICAAIKDIFEDTRAIAEPAGALALAGLKQYVARSGARGEQLVAIVSGANVNFDRLRYIAELAELGEQREVLIAATIPERPGSFREFCHTLGPRLVTEFNYRYADQHDAHVFAGVQIRHGDQERQALLANLRDKGYPVEDLTGDDMAKMHVRYMVGGHGGSVENEVIYRFEFPERPGALVHFLTQLGNQWNISMFHYRNHGAAYGHVLIGMQVAPAERASFAARLDTLGLAHWEETANPAYRLFLR
ncbi:MAG: threonine ammonia-lyase, biosynthetic [Gammaproteobacteria bacterium]|nr:threonine ammonia-lyase, biosynthetic [Gammaproteobacteria bacterium]